MSGMPTTQQALLSQAITAINTWRATALGVTGGPVELTQVNMLFPPPAGAPPETAKTPIVFSWDVEAGQFRVDT
jgi:hypothetical protein